MQSNIYEYILDKFPSLPEVLRLCGADKKHIGKNASDFEKFRELCHALVNFSGSSLYRDINCAVSELFGEIDITQSNAQELWKRFYGECKSRETVTPVLTIRLFDIDALDAINISGASDFVRPDKYHADLAKEKMLNGQGVCEREKDILIMQELRETAEKCVKASQPLVIVADCPTKITYSALEYLSDCKLLPKTLILTDISGVTAETSRLLEFESASLGAVVSACDERIKDSMRSLAEILPVGNILWTLKKEDFAELCTVSSELFEEWRANKIAPQKCALKFEEKRVFYYIKLLTIEKA